MVMISIPEAQTVIEQGGVIAYPTEAVYGLGCSAFNTQAVQNLLKLKRRPAQKGLIILIKHYEQLWPLITLPPNDPLLNPVREAWPGHVTFLFPKSDKVPDCVSGEHDTIAIRMSAHPVARELSAITPICSTSANTAGTPPLLSTKDITTSFGEGLNGIVEGALGDNHKPSTIIDISTQAVIRS